METFYNSKLGVVFRYILFIPVFLITSGLVKGTTQWMMNFFDNWSGAAIVPTGLGVYCGSVISAMVFPGRHKAILVGLYIAFYIAFFSLGIYGFIKSGESVQNPFEVITTTGSAVVGYVLAYKHLKSEQQSQVVRKTNKE